MMASQGEKSSAIGVLKNTKACISCRRQKMKCQVDTVPPCRRCRTAKTECIFKPRTNAALITTEELIHTPVASFGPKVSDYSQAPDVLSRLAVIEEILGIKRPGARGVNGELLDGRLSEERGAEFDDVSLQGVFSAAKVLKRSTRGSKDSMIWSQAIIRKLWYSFLENTPGLHFLSTKQAFASPTPLLLASVLYVAASSHKTKVMADLSPDYFAAVTSAIGDLALPTVLPNDGSNINSSEAKLTEETRAFSDVLGVVLAGLTSEAYVQETGIWISMGYRILLDKCPIVMNEGSVEWRGLFAGLQTIDLEHASLHMSQPVLPLEPPLMSLMAVETSQADAFRRLGYLQRNGLSNFSNRGLPTIWSAICQRNQDILSTAIIEFSDKDAQVIKEWANRLDEWLEEVTNPSQQNISDHERMVIFLQYHLHKLFVLSIYYPARGFDIFSNTVAMNDRLELLKSARTALRLHQADMGIWSNWDLVMITWAALLIIQGVIDGICHQEDLHLVEDHQTRLRTTLQPAPNLRTRLAHRLESTVQAMSTPPAQLLDVTDASFGFGDAASSIFDPNNIELANVDWLDGGEEASFDVQSSGNVNHRALQSMGWFSGELSLK